MTGENENIRIVPLALYNSWSPLYRAIADEFIAEKKWKLEAEAN